MVILKAEERRRHSFGVVLGVVLVLKGGTTNEFPQNCELQN